MHRFKKCNKPDCFRLTHEGTLYCCSNCRVADENGAELEDDPNAHWLLRHTDSCDQRKLQRAEMKVGDYDTQLV